jgi:hypothetical protein
MARDDLDIPMQGQGSSWRVSRPQSVLDAATRRVLLIAGGVGGTMLLLVGIYSLSTRHPAGIPVIEADARPLREKPKNPGGMEIFGADDAVLGGTSGKDAMAPPPEAPAPAALLAQERAAQAPATPPAAAPVAPVPAVPSPVPSAPVPSAPVSSAPVSSAPVSSARLAAASVSETKPLPTATAVAPAKPAMQAASAPASQSGTGGTQVQLAALTTEQAALSEWERLARKMPELLGTRRPSVSRTEREGKIWFRLRTGGFSDVAQATSFCQHMREKGAGCSIASF